MSTIKISATFFLVFITRFAFCQLVMPGDYPDPSVVKINNSYWASATTSNWAPIFPLLKSNDLINWTTEGFVFDNAPAWADYYFWAPEISYENGKVYVYYSAHQKGGNLCLSIASADKPEGPYKDHGPLMCQEVGSIDAFPMRDENGKLFMIWKEDGNSVQKPTPIWIIEMKEDRTGFIGEKKELFRNDAEWEANLVEGVSMIRHGEYYYAFYAAAGCCGRDCSYATGVARAKSLHGPWEKDDRNPILADEGDWKCPGHGTPVEKDGRFYFLYHAYNKSSNVFTGRQGLLKEFVFNASGWIDFNSEAAQPDVKIPDTITDEFDAKELSPLWQWSVFQNPRAIQQNGKLELFALPDTTRTFIAQKTYDESYQVRIVVSLKESTAETGLAAIGDDEHMVGVSVQNRMLRYWKRDAKNETIFGELRVKKRRQLHLVMQVRNGKDIIFSFSINGKTYEVLNAQPIDGDFLPPWDRAVRAGITAKGIAGQKAVFEKFIFNN